MAVFLSVALVATAFFSRLQDKESDRSKVACDFNFSGILEDVTNDFDTNVNVAIGHRNYSEF